MDGSLPTSLKHIISNAEYYGPSLFLLGEFSVALCEITFSKLQCNLIFEMHILCHSKLVNMMHFHSLPLTFTQICCYFES